MNDVASPPNQSSASDIYSPGRLFWVRVQGFPFWPARISLDSEIGNFKQRKPSVKSSSSNAAKRHVAVTFLGTSNQRCWSVTSESSMRTFSVESMTLPSSTTTAASSSKSRGISLSPSSTTAISATSTQPSSAAQTAPGPSSAVGAVALFSPKLYDKDLDYQAAINEAVRLSARAHGFIFPQSIIDMINRCHPTCLSIPFRELCIQCFGSCWSGGDLLSCSGCNALLSHRHCAQQSTSTSLSSGLGTVEGDGLWYCAKCSSKRPKLQNVGILASSVSTATTAASSFMSAPQSSLPVVDSSHAQVTKSAKPRGRSQANNPSSSGNFKSTQPRTQTHDAPCFSSSFNNNNNNNSSNAGLHQKPGVEQQQERDKKHDQADDNEIVNDEVCFVCGEGSSSRYNKGIDSSLADGSINSLLKLCDFPLCTSVYHQMCVVKIFPQSIDPLNDMYDTNENNDGSSTWVCPRHFCVQCGSGQVCFRSNENDADVITRHVAALSAYLGRKKMTDNGSRDTDKIPLPRKHLLSCMRCPVAICQDCETSDSSVTAGDEPRTGLSLFGGFKKTRTRMIDPAQAKSSSMFSSHATTTLVCMNCISPAPLLRLAKILECSMLHVLRSRLCLPFLHPILPGCEKSPGLRDFLGDENEACDRDGLYDELQDLVQGCRAQSSGKSNGFEESKNDSALLESFIHASGMLDCVPSSHLANGCLILLSRRQTSISDSVIDDAGEDATDLLSLLGKVRALCFVSSRSFLLQWGKLRQKVQRIVLSVSTDLQFEKYIIEKRPLLMAFDTLFGNLEDQLFRRLVEIQTAEEAISRQLQEQQEQLYGGDNNINSNHSNGSRTKSSGNNGSSVASDGEVDAVDSRSLKRSLSLPSESQTTTSTVQPPQYSFRRTDVKERDQPASTSTLSIAMHIGGDRHESVECGYEPADKRFKASNDTAAQCLYDTDEMMPVTQLVDTHSVSSAASSFDLYHTSSFLLGGGDSQETVFPLTQEKEGSVVVVAKESEQAIPSHGVQTMDDDQPQPSLSKDTIALSGCSEIDAPQRSPTKPMLLKEPSTMSCSDKDDTKEQRRASQIFYHYHTLLLPQAPTMSIWRKECDSFPACLLPYLHYFYYSASLKDVGSSADRSLVSLTSSSSETVSAGRLSGIMESGAVRVVPRSFVLWEAYLESSREALLSTALLQQQGQQGQKRQRRGATKASTVSYESNVEYDPDIEAIQAMLQLRRLNTESDPNKIQHSSNDLDDDICDASDDYIAEQYDTNTMTRDLYARYDGVDEPDEAAELLECLRDASVKVLEIGSQLRRRMKTTHALGGSKREMSTLDTPHTEEQPLPLTIGDVHFIRELKLANENLRWCLRQKSKALNASKTVIAHLEDTVRELTAKIDASSCSAKQQQQQQDQQDVLKPASRRSQLSGGRSSSNSSSTFSSSRAVTEPRRQSLRKQQQEGEEASAEDTADPSFSVATCWDEEEHSSSSGPVVTSSSITTDSSAASRTGNSGGHHG